MYSGSNFCIFDACSSYSIVCLQQNNRIPEYFFILQKKKKNTSKNGACVSANFYFSNKTLQSQVVVGLYASETTLILSILNSFRIRFKSIKKNMLN